MSVDGRGIGPLGAGFQYQTGHQVAARNKGKCGGPATTLQRDYRTSLELAPRPDLQAKGGGLIRLPITYIPGGGEEAWGTVNDVVNAERRSRQLAVPEHAPAHDLEGFERGGSGRVGRHQLGPHHRLLHGTAVLQEQVKNRLPFRSDLATLSSSHGCRTVSDRLIYRFTKKAENGIKRLVDLGRTSL